MNDTAEVSQAQQIFDICVKQDKSKNETIMELATRGGLDITQAVREYTKMAKGAGLVLGAAERTLKVDEILEENDIADADVRRELIPRIADQFDVSEATAAAHIRKYAEKHGIELPVQNRTSLEDMVAHVKDLLDADKTRAEVVENLQKEMGYTANSAASAYSRATRELGIASGRSTTQVPLPDLVTFMREREGLTRKQMTQALVNNFGYAETTAGSFCTYWNFAKEYAKQVVEAS